MNENRFDGSMPNPANEASTGPEAFVSAANRAGEIDTFATFWKLWLWARETEEKVDVVARQNRHILENEGNMATATPYAGVYSKNKPTLKKEATARAKRRRG